MGGQGGLVGGAGVPGEELQQWADTFVSNLESHSEPSERVEHLSGPARPPEVGGALLSPGLPGHLLQQPPN